MMAFSHYLTVILLQEVPARTMHEERRNYIHGVRLKSSDA